MEHYAQALTIAIPFFLILIVLEAIVSHFKGQQVNRPMDTISSLSSGMTFTLKQLLGLTVVILSYEWMVDHLAIFSLEPSWWVYLFAFIGLDFAGYWKHRLNHSVNILWNRHIIHHSSEEFNLACALRQNISIVFQVYFFLYIPMAIIGIPVKVVAVIAPIHFFAQFWYHTKLIDKMGWLEYIIVTPSHHRVHHAINDEYIDKNFSEIFIVWDKIFGTFQPELKSVPAVYGIKKPAKTWNPVYINFQHLWQLIKDAWHTNHIIDKFKIWFMPTGWRPEDVKENFPIKIDTAATQIKYETNYSKIFLSWIIFQLVLMNIIQYYLLSSISEFMLYDFTYLTLFIFISIFSYSALMDGDRTALIGEVIKIALGGIIISRISSFPLIEYAHKSYALLIAIYLASSIVVSIYFLLIKPSHNKIKSDVQLNPLK